MTQLAVVMPDSIIDQQPVGRFQFGVFALCSACLFLEGFDAQAISFTAPAIIKSWGITAPSFGPVLSAGPLGLLIGVIVFGMLSDRLGRRPMALACVVAFGGGTLVTVMTHNVVQLTIVRLVTGCALGGVIPIVYALTGEFCPASRRAATAMIMGAGLPLGITMGGPVAAALVPHFGWQAVFYVGGVLPLALALLLAAFLPESIRYLALHTNDDRRIGDLLQKMYPRLRLPDGVSYASPEAKDSWLTVRLLFADGRSARTLLAWTMVFMNMLTYYGLLSWLPTVIAQAGHSFQRAVITASLLPFSGIVAALTVGWIADRFNACLVLGCLYLAGGLFTVLIGQSYASPELLLVIIACAGFGLIGGQNASNPVVLGLYPTSMRATGFGWANAVGRVGSIAGPALGAVLLSLHWSAPKLFLVSAVPATCAALAAFSLIPVLPSKRRTKTTADESIPSPRRV